MHQSLMAWQSARAPEDRQLSVPVQPSGSSVCVSLSSNCMKQWHSKGECSGNLSAAIGGNSACSLDLYAFDRYPLIMPTPIDPQSPWSCATLADAIDDTECRLRGFGGAAASNPIFCAELQAG